MPLGCPTQSGCSFSTAVSHFTIFSKVQLQRDSPVTPSPREDQSSSTSGPLDAPHTWLQSNSLHPATYYFCVCVLGKPVSWQRGDCPCPHSMGAPDTVLGMMQPPWMEEQTSWATGHISVACLLIGGPKSHPMSSPGTDEPLKT